MNFPGIRVMLLSVCAGGAVFGLLVFAVIFVAADGFTRTSYDREVVAVMAAMLAIAVAPVGAGIGGLTAMLAARCGLVWSAVVGAGLGFACGGFLSVYVVLHQNDFDATPVSAVPYLLGVMAAIGAVTAGAARLVAVKVNPLPKE